MLSVDDLRFFSVIADKASLAQAARALDVTPPAVSQRLTALERRLGVRLVDRLRSGVQLTNEGQLVAGRARMILDELDGLQSQVLARRDELHGPIRIGAPLGFGRRYVAELVAAFHAAHPGVTLDLVLFDRPRESADRFDMIIQIGEVRDIGGVMVKLAPNRRIICASPDYISRRGAPRTAQDLKRHDCLVLRENDEDATLWRLVHSGQPLSVRVTPKLASNDGEVIREWALAGRGLMIRSEWHVAQDLRAGRLLSVLEDFEPPQADVVVVLAPSKARVARIQHFLDYLKASLNPAPWRREPASD